MCGPHFCAMKITHDIRDQAQILQNGLEQKSREFLESGAKIYKKI
jgi:phosphomethylpyrimidine synthase